MATQVVQAAAAHQAQGSVVAQHQIKAVRVVTVLAAQTFLVVVAANLLGNALRDLLDPGRSR